MTIDKKREIIEEAFNYYHDRTSLTSKEEKQLLNLVNELYEAISVTRCCTELCDCAMPDPIDPFAEVDKDTCRKCNNLIA